jgi:hypothetical protein
VRELSLHILDLLENSLEAGATTISLRIVEDSRLDLLEIVVADNGRGMTAEMARLVTDPFCTSRTTRRVGLGLPLLAAACERCAGKMEIDSSPGAGTTVRATFQRSHLDRAPLGDIVDSLLSVVLHEPPVALQFVQVVDGKVFSMDTPEVAGELGDVPLTHPSVLRWLRGYLMDGLAELHGGDADA